MLYSNMLNKESGAEFITILPNNARFKFQLGLNFEELEPLRARVDEACVRLFSIGFIPNLEKITRPIDFTSIYSTNAIEGGTADLDLVEKVIESNFEKPENEAERRIRNLANAYHDIEKYYNPPKKTKLYSPDYLKRSGALSKLISPINSEDFVFPLRETLFQSLNKTIMEDLPMEVGSPGIYRNDKEPFRTEVGNANTGGVYKPPRKAEFIKLLMNNFIDWVNSEFIGQLSVLYRAPLVHLYYEIIHPFADGNGRVGRLVELVLLGNTGYEYVGKMMPGFYYRDIKKYFTLFNECRKSKEKYPNTPFVRFFLEGMLDNINRLHDMVNEEIARFYYSVYLDSLCEQKKINARQLGLIKLLFSQRDEITNLLQLKKYPAYKGLYHGLTDKTEYRDLKILQENNLLLIDLNKNIHVLYTDPAIILSDHPFCTS